MVKLYTIIVAIKYYKVHIKYIILYFSAVCLVLYSPFIYQRTQTNIIVVVVVVVVVVTIIKVTIIIIIIRIIDSML
jgi:hypothetical protein